MDEDTLLEAFRYHPPDGQEQIEAYQHIRHAGFHLALTIAKYAPSCADQSAAIRKVREAVMTANAAVALGGRI